VLRAAPAALLHRSAGNQELSTGGAFMSGKLTIRLLALLPLLAVGDRLSAQEPTTLKAHNSAVAAVAFSPDGKLLATGAWDEEGVLDGARVKLWDGGRVKLWDATNGRPKAALPGKHGGRVVALSFSADSRRLVSVDSHSVSRVWDVAKEEKLAEFKGHAWPVRAAALSPDGRMLATGEFAAIVKVINLWHVDAGKHHLSIKADETSVRCLVFSPDGKVLASGHDRIVKLWDVKTGKELKTLTGHTDDLASLAFGPDGKTLASASYDKTVKLWEVATGKESATLKHATSVFAVLFTDNKTVATCSLRDLRVKDPGQVKLWDAATYECR